MRFLLLMFLASCSTQQSPSPNSNSQCVNNSGTTSTCSQGTCSHVGGAGCSDMVDGVACCNTVNDSPTNNNPKDGTNACALGWCWTNPENICCPQNAQYACNGECYTTNVCHYTYYMSACHTHN